MRSLRREAHSANISEATGSERTAQGAGETEGVLIILVNCAINGGERYFGKP